MLGIYTRLSQNDDTSNSISNQKREGKDFAEKMNLSFKIYDEGMGVSATNEIEDRPMLDQLLKDIISKKITHVWFRNQNRLERDSKTFHVFADIAKKNNIKVYFNDRLEDWNNPNSFLHSSILTALNEYQASLQSHQTKKALLDNVKEGKSFGIYPYGYKSENGVLVIDDLEAEIVKLIYEHSLNGIGTRTIAETLNEKNVPTRYNKYGSGTLTTKNKYTGRKTVQNKTDVKWSGNSVRNIIVNTIYKGKRKWVDNFYDAPAIFDEDYWQKVNDNLKNNSNNKGRKVEHKYLLKGLLRCGVCGRNMYGRTRENKKDHYYQCSSKRIKNGSCGNRSIHIDKIEGVIWSRFFKGDELLILLKRDVKKDDVEIERIKGAIETHSKKLNSYQVEFSELIRLSTKKIFSDDELTEERSRIKNSIEREQKFILDYKTQINNAKKSKELEVDYEVEFKEYSKNLTFLERKEIVKKYIKEVVVYSWKRNFNVHTLLVRFNINIKDEIYIFDKKNSGLFSMNHGEFVLSKFFNNNIVDTYLTLDKKILEMFHVLPNREVIEPPYILKDDSVQIQKNTIVPYGNVENWDDEKIIDFYTEYPEMLSMDTGLSSLTLDETEPGYKIAKEKFHSFKKQKNFNLADWLKIIKKAIKEQNNKKY